MSRSGSGDEVGRRGGDGFRRRCRTHWGEAGKAGVGEAGEGEREYKEGVAVTGEASVGAGGAREGDREGVAAEGEARKGDLW